MSDPSNVIIAVRILRQAVEADKPVTARMPRGSDHPYDVWKGRLPGVCASAQAHRAVTVRDNERIRPLPTC